VIADLDGAQLVSEQDSTLCDQKGRCVKLWCCAVTHSLTHAHNHTHTHTHTHTSPAYVSPEVLLCQPYDGKAADVWALGVVLFVVLTGSYPFQDNRPTTLFQKIQQASAGVSFPSTMSERAKKLIKRLLAKDPARRPTALELLEEPWLVAQESPAHGPRLQRASSSSSFASMASSISDEDEEEPVWTLGDFEVPDVGSPLPARSARHGHEARGRNPRSLKIDTSDAAQPVCAGASSVSSPSTLAIFFRETSISKRQQHQFRQHQHQLQGPAQLQDGLGVIREGSVSPASATDSVGSAASASSSASSGVLAPTAPEERRGMRRNLSAVKRRTSLSLEEEVAGEAGADADPAKKAAPLADLPAPSPMVTSI
jgi:serine/threonine protein kinase